MFAEEKFHYPDEEGKRPSVPRKDDMPPMGLKTTKNFINQVDQWELFNHIYVTRSVVHA